MTTRWMGGVKVVDLSGSRGNGPFKNFLGVCLHVNVDEAGTPDSFWRNNPGEVTPNFQVYKDGTIHQMLPFNWQPWCQINGNFNYAAIETAGLPSEPLTARQLHSIARILKVYHNQMGMVLRVANTPGVRGLITHQAGGAAWGGHSCPGTIRAGQRSHILDLTRALVNPPTPTPAPTRPRLRYVWPSFMGVDDYFGLQSGPEHSRGGANPAERPAIALIQDRLHQLGFYKGGDERGHFRSDTKAAVKAWQLKYYKAQTTLLGEVWEDDWRHLFTY